ncbi:MAG: hypothetical protein IJ009_00060 [Clostridia bacterium]|nr:hypothetical protein [Clostridia bacterium]
MEMKTLEKNRAHLRRLVLDALLVAFHVLWAFVPSEFSWQSLPVFLCAFLVGPADALVVATIGSFVEQMYYGISLVSLAWMAPWVIFGLAVALGAFLIRKNDRPWLVALVIVAGEIILNLGNTTVLCGLGYLSADFSAPFAVLTLLYLGRLSIAMIRAVLSAVVVPLLLIPLRRVLSHR